MVISTPTKKSTVELQQEMWDAFSQKEGTAPVYSPRQLGIDIRDHTMVIKQVEIQVGMKTSEGMQYQEPERAIAFSFNRKRVVSRSNWLAGRAIDYTIQKQQECAPISSQHERGVVRADEIRFPENGTKEAQLPRLGVDNPWKIDDPYSITPPSRLMKEIISIAH